MTSQEEAIRQVAHDIASALSDLTQLVDSREKSLVRTKLEEAFMWLERLKEHRE